MKQHLRTMPEDSGATAGEPVRRSGAERGPRWGSGQSPFPAHRAVLNLPSKPRPGPVPPGVTAPSSGHVHPQPWSLYQGTARCFASPSGGCQRAARSGRTGRPLGRGGLGSPGAVNQDRPLLRNLSHSARIGWHRIQPALVFWAAVLVRRGLETHFAFLTWTGLKKERFLMHPKLDPVPGRGIRPEEASVWS